MARIPAVLAALGVAWLISWWPHRSDFRITVLPLRGGDSLFVNGPLSAGDLLIDCGNSDGAERLVKPFLRGQGVNRLSALMLTHGDLLHVGGADAIVGEFNVRVVLTSQAPSRSAAYRRTIEDLKRSPGRLRQLVRGDRLGPWTVLHPAEGDQFTQADDNVIVLRGDFHGIRVLCCSDLGRLGQSTLLDRGVDLGADILIAGMPNAGEPLSGRLLDAVLPRGIIVSAGRYPGSERASAALRLRLAQRAVPVLFTSDVGAVTVTLRPQGWEIRTMSGGRYSGERGDGSR
jgi:competence protein ComEC